MLTHALWLAACLPAHVQFGRAVREPARVQAALLRHLLKSNAGTAFGMAHGFGRLSGVKDFQHAVPLRDYDDFAPWIERVAAGQSNVLTAEPVRLLEPSG